MSGLLEVAELAWKESHVKKTNVDVRLLCKHSCWQLFILIFIK